MTEGATAASTLAVVDMTEKLRGEVEQSRDKLREAAEIAAAVSSQAVAGLTTRLREEVEQSSFALRGAAQNSAASSTQAVAGLTEQLRQEIEQSSHLLREALERSAGQSVGALSGAGERLRNELVQVLDKLGATSSTLERIVGAASGNLDAIQGGLAERVGEFQRALGSISSQIVALGRASTTTQQEASALADRLGTHANALAGATHDLTSTQDALDAALDRRRQTLEALVEQVGDKSDAFETLMRSFTATIEDSLNRAHARAKDVHTSLAQTTSGATSAMSSQFEQIRDNAGKEREKTAAALQAAYDQANTQLSAIMNQATERFRQSAAEMRTMAGEITKELEATRRELQRGVLELPRETSEQAAAMRRVVGDQIKALNELAEIVARSGASFDVSEPTPPSVPPAPPPRALEAPREAPRRPEPLRPLAELSAQEAPRARAQTRSAPPGPAATPAERAQGGWLSDLLSRASRDEEEQPQSDQIVPRPIGDSLDAISLDIAALIDPDAAAEMWERWRQGDSGAFSRRLYTPQGQQTFDEIRRRCKADPQFRETVARYTQEFERLLTTLGRDDRDGSQSRAYLLSETGRVYTMLAHASGRLG